MMNGLDSRKKEPGVLVLKEDLFHTNNVELIPAAEMKYQQE